MPGGEFPGGVQHTGFMQAAIISRPDTQHFYRALYTSIVIAAVAARLCLSYCRDVNFFFARNERKRLRDDAG